MVDLPLEVDRQKKKEITSRNLFCLTVDPLKDLIDVKCKCELYLSVKTLDNPIL